MGYKNKILPDNKTGASLPRIFHLKETRRSLLLIFFSFLFFAAACKKPAPAEPKNQEPVIVSYTWSLDTLFNDNIGGPPPSYIALQSVWGTSVNNIWAVGNSDDPAAFVWHYNGKKWSLDKKWAFNGIENGKTFLVYPSSVTGFDSNNVFIAADKSFDDPRVDSGIVLKWNGSSWKEVPYAGGKRVNGGFAWIEPQNKSTCWALSAAGYVVRYENGYLFPEPRFNYYRLLTDQIAPLSNGEVYLSAYLDSLSSDRKALGTMTRLYKRTIDGTWSLIEEKFMAGTDFDGVGYGRGVSGIGNRWFTSNRGIWERKNNSWIKILDIDYGGSCFVNENDIWFYYKKEIWHTDGKTWTRVAVPEISGMASTYLYGRGWSDGKEVFLPLISRLSSFILHGKPVYK